MTNSTPSTHQKALTLNLDDRIYGTIAEIGAAQEVARWFFRVGAAAGSVAKTMSAYDKQISDDIYGDAGRYVSRERLESMLDHEYELLVQRLTDSRGSDTRFFAFCNSVSARNYAGTNECQGWVGLRFQSQVGGAPNTIILHINMLDNTSLAQQEAVGILGVNLIHAAFFERNGSGHGLLSLGDNIATGRLEADLVDASGPAFEGVDAMETGMILVQGGFARAVLFDHTGQQQPPTEVLHKRPAIIQRTSLRRTVPPGWLDAAARRLVSQDDATEKEPVAITEFSIGNVHGDGEQDTDRSLAHLRSLAETNEWVMLTGLGPNFRVTSYIRRYSQQPLRYVVGMSSLVMLFAETFYSEAGRSLLEVTGKLFSENVKVYAEAMQYDDFMVHLHDVGLGTDWFDLSVTAGEVTLETVSFQGPLQHLYDYLRETGRIEALANPA